MANGKNSRQTNEAALFNEIFNLMEQTKAQVTSQVNNAMTWLFWQDGRRINEIVLDNKRAEYGKQKVVTSSRHLSWSHFLVLIPLKTKGHRQFYANQAIKKHLVVRGLRKQVTQKKYERAAIANRHLPDKEHYLSDNFKDPYLLDFRNLPAECHELDLENN